MKLFIPLILGAIFSFGSVADSRMYQLASKTRMLAEKVRDALVQATSQPQTWREFVNNGGSGEVSVDFNLPSEFRNGFVYFNYDSNQITAFIFKRGLSSYPSRENGLEEIDNDVADQYVKKGQAIVLNWNLGDSGLVYANNPSVRFPRKGTGCLRITCLTAIFLNEEEITAILRSERKIK